MRVPRHYLNSRDFSTFRQLFITSSSGYGYEPLEQFIYCPDGDEVSDLFYDTNRGKDTTNDCVHSRVAGPSHIGVTGFCNLHLPDGSLGVPQRSWNTGLKKVNYSYRNYISFHKMLWVPNLQTYRPVQFLFEYDFRCDGRGRWPYTSYGIWAADVRIGYAYTAVVPTSASEGYEVAGYSGWITFDCKSNTPLIVNSSSQGSFKLPSGYMVPGTILPNYVGSSLEGLVNEFHQCMEASLPHILDFINIRGSNRQLIRVKVASNPVLPPNDRGNFLFNEDLMIIDHLPDQVVRNPNTYWRNWLVQHAYLEALQSVPTLSDNSISNIIEIVSFIKGLVVDHEIEIPKRLQDAWLSYRYQFSTGKMDVEEAISFMKRHVELGSLDREIKCYGRSETTVGDTVVTCRCSLSIQPTDLGYVGRLWRALETYGLTPDFYVIWDMIPYSFIVDWFIPVGDILSVVDAERRFASTNYHIRDVCFSLSYLRNIDTYCFKQYARWRADPLETFNAFYWFDKPKTSAKVQMYRLADAASLIIGR